MDGSGCKRQKARERGTGVRGTDVGHEKVSLEKRGCAAGERWLELKDLHWGRDSKDSPWKVCSFSRGGH